MSRLWAAALAFSITAAFSVPAFAGPYGQWKRPNGTTAKVYNCGGKLCGKVVQTNFEMFHGMSKTGTTKWQGSKMKHPDMPGFMTFNGTVTLSGNKMTVKGCAIGSVFCDAETWVRLK